MVQSDARAKLTDAPLTDNERFKSNSDYLRGTITDDLQDGLTGGFTGDNFQLIRFHGMYEQDDRDIRAERVAQKLEPLKNVMMRLRLPGGIISPKQWLGIDVFASEHSLYGSIRLTNRQTLQLHGVFKQDIKAMHQWLHQLQLDSIATSGDINRNVLCTSNPVESALHREAYEHACRISTHLLPRTQAYADVWLDGEKVFSVEPLPPQTGAVSGDPIEPINGKSYLPRKFKTTVVIPPLNDVDIHANDLNFVAIGENGHLIGFNVLVGGGLSTQHGNHDTYPNTAFDFGFVTKDQVLQCAEAIITTQRDWGDRTNRQMSKTRYTLQRVGVEVFKDEVEQRQGFKFSASRPYEFTERGDRIGWVQGENNQWHLTLFIPQGRLLDYPDRPLKTGMRELAKIHKGDFRITANQNIIVAGVAEADKASIETLARQYALIDDRITQQRLHSMACVALPTCPLAMAESERLLPSFIDKVDHLMAKNGLQNEHIVLRISGCPNGCSRNMLAEIGLVGKALGRYNLVVGGNRIGTRLARIFKENITESEILTILEQWISTWSNERQQGEAFGDFAIRSGIIKPVINAPVDFWDADQIAV